MLLSVPRRQRHRRAGMPLMRLLGLGVGMPPLDVLETRHPPREGTDGMRHRLQGGWLMLMRRLQLAMRPLGQLLLGLGMRPQSCLVVSRQPLVRSRDQGGMRRQPVWAVQPLVVLVVLRHLLVIPLGRRHLVRTTLPHQLLARSLVDL